MTETHIFHPQTRADWFLSGAGMVRKNMAGWDPKGDLPLPGVRVCLFSFYNEKYDALAAIAEPNWNAYCERHGYALRTYPGMYHEDPTKPATFGDKGKFELYYDLRGLFDVVMFLDIDSVFVDMEKPIEDALGLGPFIWTFGDGGPMSGLWIAAKHPTVERHLRYAYEYAAANNHVRHGAIEPNGISDQDAMTALMGVPPFDVTFGRQNLASAEAIGFCYDDTTNQNPWIITCRGGSVEEKLAVMRKRAPLLATLPPDGESAAVTTPVDLPAAFRTPQEHPVDAYNPAKDFDRNWVGPPDMKPRVYRSQSEKDTWYAVAVENEYRIAGPLQPDDVIIDIGAHIGSFCYLAHRLGSRAVYGFEIDRFHYDAAVANLEHARDAVALFHAAVVRGDERRAAEYHYNGAWNSFGAIGPAVQSTSLDEIIAQVTEHGSPVRFIKLDCEGGEWPILYTSKRLDQVQQIAGEYHLISADGVPELSNLPYPITTEALRYFLELKGFEVEIVPHAETNGNFYATRIRRVKSLVPPGGDPVRPDALLVGKIE